MKTQDWINEQKIEAVQDRKDGKDYWKHDNLYTETDLIELMEAFVLYSVSNSLQEHKQVIKDLIQTYIINVDDDGELKATITELMELSDRAVKLIKQ